MEQFDHLSIFISIIIALGFRHLILGFVSLINFRGKIKLYYPTIVWMVFLMLLQLLIWWVLFYQHTTSDWRFYKFLLYLIIPIGVSMMGHLLLPDLKPETDLEETYDHNRNWFFGLIAVIAFIGITQGSVSSSGFSFNLDLWFLIILFVLSACGLFIRLKRMQFPLSLAFLVWIVAYISIFFTRLG